MRSFLTHKYLMNLNRFMENWKFTAQRNSTFSVIFTIFLWILSILFGTNNSNWFWSSKFTHKSKKGHCRNPGSCNANTETEQAKPLNVEVLWTANFQFIKKLFDHINYLWVRNDRIWRFSLKFQSMSPSRDQRSSIVFPTFKMKIVLPKL